MSVEDGKEFQYFEVPDLSRAEIEALIATDDKRKLHCAILSTAHFLIEDYDFCLKICRDFGFHNDREIRSSILSALALISKRYRKIDGELVKKIIKFSAQDTTDRDMCSYAEIIKEDIEHYAQLYFISFPSGNPSTNLDQVEPITRPALSQPARGDR